MTKGRALRRSKGHRRHFRNIPFPWGSSVRHSVLFIGAVLAVGPWRKAIHTSPVGRALGKALGFHLTTGVCESWAWSVAMSSFRMMETYKQLNFPAGVLFPMLLFLVMFTIIHIKSCSTGIPPFLPFVLTSIFSLLSRIKIQIKEGWFCSTLLFTEIHNESTRY